MRRYLILLLFKLVMLIPLIRSISGSAISQPSIPDESSQISKLYKSFLPPKPKQDVALVAALDGTVYFVDTNSRKVRWSFSSDCGDDWELYVHSKRFGKLQKLALSPEEYVKMTPHISEDGEITLGFKRTTAFLVDAKTGRVVRTYGFDNSTSTFGAQYDERNALLLVKDAELIKSAAAVADLGTVQHLVYITRTDYVLQHYSPNSTDILWNVAFADIEAEFRCQGLRSSLSGVSPSASDDVDEIEFPCQMRTPVLRVRDHSFLEFDKLAIAHLGAGARFLPAPDHILPLGPVQRYPLALPTHEDRVVLALPASEAANPRNLGLPSGIAGINGTNLSSEIITNSHMWPIIAAILSIVGSICYNYLTFRKKNELNKPVEELKQQAGVPKKKKSKRSGNKQSPTRERRQRYLPLENNVGDDVGVSHVEENERKLLTFANVVDGRIDGRKIGKLIVSNKEIAKGSNGTVVLEGIYDGRSVAVKRLVQTHHDVALKEIQNLIASDQHPNIVRWYGVEYDQDFVYLALERCTCSLNDFIYVYSQSFQNQVLSKDVDSNCLPVCTVQSRTMLEYNRNIELWKTNGHPSLRLLKLMRDVVYGLAHLHELGIIHRDLKPQNVLIINEKSFCAKLSDMGISKRLVGDMSSLTRNTTGYGSSGWQAPEQLLQGRQTRAVDLFSLGCVLFFCVTGGKHPFGDNIERDVNIVNDRKDLFLVESIPEAMDLFSHLLDPNPDKRPKAQEVLNHPLFWTPEQRLLFLQDISDRVELEDRENESEILNALESTGAVALNGKWDEKMEAAFINNIGRYRRYKYDSVRDLLRVIRNKSHHYRELPQEIKELLGSHPEGFENYFSSRFPKLLIEVYKVMYRYCKEEEFFRKYIESSVI
ncbi:serine/threonine-protein kinase/endoribonuclease IRE1b-like isoform X2 [Ricinus communis]|uniref:serine/threonine-protein kinase/endoribonuclease IRE1b-like isoform X2 n=1 Tax=Ricinus communis TaxID=3988 RepID=UPI00201B177B|nr:serine/threonine-protein kinase/endoribonuclease IRE1b-like isoform X2 [Ricinus communis]